MTSTETVTTAVAQALFHVAADGSVSVVASSLDGREAEAAWLDLVRPHLSFAESIDVSAPLRALSYVVFPGGFAAVLCRTWDPQRPEIVETHALLGEENTVTAELALSTADWPGRPAWPAADRRLPPLAAGELREPVAAGRFRARALAQGDLLAHSLAWLLQSPATPIGFLGCPPPDRTAILWALREIAAPELPGRRWAFATHDDGAVDGGFDAALETMRRLPAQFALQLAGIDRVAAIVAGAILHIGNKRLVLAPIGQRLLGIEQCADRLHHRNVVALGIATHVVRFAHPATFQHAADGAAMVTDKQPIADVQAIAIHRKRFSSHGLLDHQRDQLFGKLIRPIVVRAVGGEGG